MFPLILKGDQTPRLAPTLEREVAGQAAREAVDDDDAAVAARIGLPVAQVGDDVARQVGTEGEPLVHVNDAADFLERLAVVRAELDRIGIALDFRKLKQELDSLLEEYDHRNLSELPEFQEINPTSEVLARTIYRRMGEKMNEGPIRVWKVRVGESDSSAVTYFED